MARRSRHDGPDTFDVTLLKPLSDRAAFLAGLAGELGDFVTR